MTEGSSDFQTTADCTRLCPIVPCKATGSVGIILEALPHVATVNVLA